MQFLDEVFIGTVVLPMLLPPTRMRRFFLRAASRRLLA
jgi:hypothetical protein